MLLVFDLQLQTWDEPAKTLPAQSKQRREGVSVQRELSAVVWSGGGPAVPGVGGLLFQVGGP